MGLLRIWIWVALSLVTTGVSAQADKGDYVLGAGDVVKISVFQNPELTVEARVSENGVISYPLIGTVKLSGFTNTEAEALIQKRLRDGNFIQNPSVTLNVLQFRSQQVSVLGNVNRPGRYPLETTGMRLSEVLALAGGISVNGADSVIITTNRSGKPEKHEVDLAKMFLEGQMGKDMVMAAGDAVYVHRAPQYYIYGQVNRPGNYTIERGMTLAQAIAKGGGITLRGTDKNVRLQRRNGESLVNVDAKLDELIKPDDLVHHGQNCTHYGHYRAGWLVLGGKPFKQGLYRSRYQTTQLFV
jgi:polysaccharide biosynthesis/export protein